MTEDTNKDRRSDEELALLAACSPESPEGRSASCVVLGRYVKIVYRWCFGYVRDRDAAEDLAQNVLLRAHGHIQAFEGWGRFSAWLFIITRNLCLDAVRQQTRQRGDPESTEALRDPRSGPDAELEEKEAEEELMLLIDRHLSPREQDALWLRCIERMPVDAITRVLGIAHASGARAVLQNARRKLRAALGKRCPVFLEGEDD